jgi:L-malate glycosyltransferase
LRGAIEEKIAALGLGGSVIMVGRSRAVAREIRLSDVLVLASESEGFSNAILQAMALGKAVVACRVGGNPEAVTEGETGLLVPAGDPASMAQALGRLVNDPALRRRMGDAARRRVIDQFPLRGVIEKIQDLIQRVVDG